jgi:hypothetical protein
MGYLIFLGHRRRQQEARARIETALRTLTEEFPEPVRQWGGLTVLRTPATVTEVLKRLPGSAPPPEPVVKPPATEPPQVHTERRAALAEKLGELADAQARAAWYGERKALPWWLALILSALFLGSPGGVATGLLFEAYNEPAAKQPFYGSAEYYDAYGRTISDITYELIRRRLPVTAALVGLASGAALTVAGAILLGWFRWYRLALLLGVLWGALLAAPAGIVAGNLYDHYYRPYSRSVAYGQERYHDWSGRELRSQVLFDLERRHIEVQAWATGIAIGVGVELAVVAVVLWRWGRRKAWLRQAAAVKARELAEWYPDVVGSWGGGERLLDPKFVEQARRQAQTAG